MCEAKAEILTYPSLLYLWSTHQFLPWRWRRHIWTVLNPPILLRLCSANHLQSATKHETKVTLCIVQVIPILVDTKASTQTWPTFASVLIFTRSFSLVLVIHTLLLGCHFKHRHKPKFGEDKNLAREVVPTHKWLLDTISSLICFQYVFGFGPPDATHPTLKGSPRIATVICSLFEIKGDATIYIEYSFNFCSPTIWYFWYLHL